MTGTTRTVLVAALVALAVLTGAALASPATTATADAQANETTTNETAANETTNRTASVSAPDQQFDGESLTVESATLPDGGFVVVHNQSGAVLGHTEYLEAGNHTDFTVSLNETLEDPQVLVLGVYRNNGSQTYNASEDTVSYMTANDNEVSDVSYVYFEERGADTTDERSTETTERSTAIETTESTDNESAVADDTEETTTESSGGIPGFTPITAVVALVAAALVGWRRS